MDSKRMPTEGQDIATSIERVDHSVEPIVVSPMAIRVARRRLEVERELEINENLTLPWRLMGELLDQREAAQSRQMLGTHARVNIEESLNG